MVVSAASWREDEDFGRIEARAQSETHTVGIECVGRLGEQQEQAPCPNVRLAFGYFGIEGEEPGLEVVMNQVEGAAAAAADAQAAVEVKAGAQQARGESSRCRETSIRRF